LVYDLEIEFADSEKDIFANVKAKTYRNRVQSDCSKRVCDVKNLMIQVE